MSIIHALSANSGRLIRITFGPGWRERRPVLAAGQAKLAKARIMMLAGGLVICYVAIFARLTYFDLEPRTDTSAIPPDHVSAARPDIVDRNGELLATDIRTVSMFAEPNRVVDPDEAVEKIASIFPDIDRKSLYKKLADHRSHFAWLRRQLTPKEQSEILALGIPDFGRRSSASTQAGAPPPIFSAMSISTTMASPAWKNISTCRACRTSRPPV